MSQVSTPHPKLYTARDIERFDAQGKRYELVAGELLPMSPTSPPHGRDTFNLSLAIGNFVVNNKLGQVYAAETGFLLSSRPDTVLAPDISFVRRAKLSEMDTKSFARCVPDLVVETRSPSDSKRQIAIKLQRWLDFGVPMVMDLDPDELQLTVLRPGHESEVLGRDDVLRGYDVLPGLIIPMSQVFLEG